jgi:hypothetical protein
VSLDEESVSKRVDRIEEMTIPSDLEDKLACVIFRLGHAQFIPMAFAISEYIY